MRINAGFFINIPAKGNHGAWEALRRQPNILAQLVPQGQAEWAASMMTDRQCYFGPAPVITTPDGTEIVVHIFGIPATSSALLDKNHRYHRRMTERLLQAPETLVRLAGVKIDVLGLGAATAIALTHGKEIHEASQRLNNPIGIVTNGNTITAGLSVEIASKAILQREVIVKSVGVVGGFGSVGSRVVTLATERFQPEQVVIKTREDGRNHHRELVAFQQQFPETDFILERDLKRAVACPLSFLASSSVEPLDIDPAWLPRQAVVIDIGKPLNTAPGLARQMPDAAIIDGSLATLPKGSSWQTLCQRMALPNNTVFGCLAETITLAWMFAKGELDDEIGKRTFIGRPDLNQAHVMMEKVAEAGLVPAVHNAHR
jgi:predicted amino acid dehydrogenase